MFDDSHILILAGQVKVKGQLSSMAKCLENPDQSISDMCRLFFAELATKDNAIYNGFIDIFSGLSNDETLAKDEMKRIIRFLVGFIDKEKHQKQLAEKLLARLPKCQLENQWQDVAFVLQTIPYKTMLSLLPWKKDLPWFWPNISNFFIAKIQ